MASSRWPVTEKNPTELIESESHVPAKSVVLTIITNKVPFIIYHDTGHHISQQPGHRYHYYRLLSVTTWGSRYYHCAACHLHNRKHDWLFRTRVSSCSCIPVTKLLRIKLFSSCWFAIWITFKSMTHFVDYCVGRSIAAESVLCSLPQTNESLRQNTLRAHLQMTTWLNYLESHPQDLDSTSYGFLRMKDQTSWYPRKYWNSDKPRPVLMQLQECSRVLHVQCFVSAKVD